MFAEKECLYFTGPDSGTSTNLILILALPLGDLGTYLFEPQFACL